MSISMQSLNGQARGQPDASRISVGDLAGLIHHSDHGSQYLSIRYTEKLAETINGLYKTEVIHQRGPWENIEAVEYATLAWVDWFNHRRLLGPIRLYATS